MLPNSTEPPKQGKHTIFINPNFARGMTQLAANARDYRPQLSVIQLPQQQQPQQQQQHVQQQQFQGPETFIQNSNIRPHVNPLFLQRGMPLQKPATTTIYMNPKFFHLNPTFLQRNYLEQQHQQIQQHQLEIKQQSYDQPQQHLHSSENTAGVVSKACDKISNSNSGGPIVHLTKRKLVRKTNLSTIPLVLPPVCISPTAELKKRYKIDRTKRQSGTVVAKPIPKIIPKTIDKKKYILNTKRKLIKRNIPPILKGTTKRFTTTPSKFNTKLKLININNILYKSTRNKLLRKDVEKSGVKASEPAAVAVPVAKTKENITYLKKTLYKIQTQNHISTAKNRSVLQLRKRFVKTNEPCAVFQRLGKCAAFEKGRCNKKHDKEQVVICPKYLRGECFDNNCLLSHNVCLAKMPVCKFYLQGNCVRDNCPYLHKKLSEKAEICPDFLRGFCKLAQKCNKRHEFVCPDLALKKKCLQVNCVFCKDKRQFKLVTKHKANDSKQLGTKAKERVPPPPASTLAKVTETESKGKIETLKVSTTLGSESNEEASSHSTRYFEGSQLFSGDRLSNVSSDSAGVETDDSTVLVTHKKPIVGSLPAFIPID